MRKTSKARYLTDRVVAILISMATLPVASGSTVDMGARFVPVQEDLFTGPAGVSSAWGDFDHDDDLDLVVVFESGEVRLYRNDMGTFTNVTEEVGLPLNGDSARAVAWGDFDGDGDLDLYVGTWVKPIPTRNYLYRNEGGKRFVEDARGLGIDLPGADTRQASWIDYDNDGDLDLFVTHRSGDNQLFRNDGARFVNVSREAGLADPRRTVGACWFDMDGDGDLDLFLANQQGDRDALYRNDRARFQDVAPELGLDQSQKTLAEGSVGCTVGDYDRDGNLDLFVASYGFNRLYHNEGGGRFKELAKALGITEPGHYVGASWGDFDNDGWLDLYVTGYERAGSGTVPRDHLFRNTGERFIDVAAQMGIADRADHGVQWADFDGDGDLDLSLTTVSQNGRPMVLRNDLEPTSRNRSIAVTVLDQAGRATRAGSEVRVYDGGGRILGTQMVATGDGYNSQSVQQVHFGLGEARAVAVEVTFMTREGRKIQREVIRSRRYPAALIVRQKP